MASALGIGATAQALARALSPDGRRLEVVALSRKVARALERAGHQVTRLEPEPPLALADAAADALCADALPGGEAAGGVISEWIRLVRNGGRVVLATPVSSRQPRHQVTALFLHAGLRDLEQTLSGGMVITLGRVHRS